MISLCSKRFELRVVGFLTPKGGVAIQVLVVVGGTIGLVFDGIELQAGVCGVNQSIKLVFESIGLL